MDAYIPPKKPYSFLAMLDDILEFACVSLVDHGRLSFWMPTSNDEDQEIKVPQHPALEIVSVCTQEFNKCKLIEQKIMNIEKLLILQGSRKLITYRRIPDSQIITTIRESKAVAQGISADELNPFRKGYFKGFKTTSG